MISYYQIHNEDPRLLHIVRIRESWDEEVGELVYCVQRVGKWYKEIIPRDGRDILQASVYWLREDLRDENRRAGVIRNGRLTVLGWNTDDDGTSYVIVRED